MVPFKFICPPRMDFFANSPYRLIRTLLIIIGAWPYRNNFFSHLRKAVVLIVSIACCICKALAIKKNNDINVMLRNVATLMAILSIVLKSMALWSSISYLKRWFDWIQYNLEYYTSREEQDILCKYAGKSHIFIWVYLVFCQLVLTVLSALYLTPRILDVIAPLNISRPHVVVFELEFFTNATEHYYAVFFQTIIGVQLGLCVIGAFEGAYVTFALHLCAVCKILGFSSRFENLFPEVTMHDCMNGNNCDFRRKLKECIENHNALLSIVDNFNLCWSTIFGVGLIVAVIFITVALFQLYKALMINHNGEQLTLFSIFICFTAGNALIYIWPGQLLIKASSVMCYRIYSARWYTACVGVQKMMILIIRMSNEPIAFYAINKIKLSFELYAQLLNASASYFMALYSVYR